MINVNKYQTDAAPRIANLDEAVEVNFSIGDRNTRRKIAVGFGESQGEGIEAGFRYTSEGGARAACRKCS